MCQQLLEIKVNKYKKDKKIKSADVATKANMSRSTLLRMLSGDGIEASKVYSLAKALESPELLAAYWENDDPILSELGFTNLNNIDTNHITMLTRARIETQEFTDKLDQMLMAIMNFQSGKDVDAYNESKFFDGFQEMLDAMHCYQAIVLKSIEFWGFEKIIQEFKQHNQKCIDRKYSVKIDKKNDTVKCQ